MKMKVIIILEKGFLELLAKFIMKSWEICKCIKFIENILQKFIQLKVLET